MPWKQTNVDELCEITKNQCQNEIKPPSHSQVFSFTQSCCIITLIGVFFYFFFIFQAPFKHWNCFKVRVQHRAVSSLETPGTVCLLKVEQNACWQFQKIQTFPALKDAPWEHFDTCTVKTRYWPARFKVSRRPITIKLYLVWGWEAHPYSTV